MTITVEHEKDGGFRFTKDGVSILLQAAWAVKPNVIVTNLLLNNCFRHINKFLQEVAAYAPEEQVSVRC
jgi:hypothetical protein